MSMSGWKFAVMTFTHELSCAIILSTLELPGLLLIKCQRYLAINSRPIICIHVCINVCIDDIFWWRWSAWKQYLRIHMYTKYLWNIAHAYSRTHTAHVKCTCIRVSGLHTFLCELSYLSESATRESDLQLRRDIYISILWRLYTLM